MSTTTLAMNKDMFEKLRSWHALTTSHTTPVLQQGVGMLAQLQH